MERSYTVLDQYRKDCIYFPMVDSEEEGCNLLRIAWEEWGPNFDALRINARNFAIFYVVGGKGYYESRGRQWVLGPGALFTIGRGHRSWMWCDSGEPMSLYAMNVAGRSAAGLLRRCLGHTHIALHVRRTAAATQIVESMFQIAKTCESEAQEICSQMFPAFLTAIASGLAGSEAEASLAFETYLRCRQYIQRNFKDMSLIAEAAEACRISPEYLCRLFKRYATMTPHEYFTRLKMNLATELVLTPGLTLQEIADRLHYADQYSFSKAFKRTHGQSPSTWRKRQG
ncbi:MAG: AraC family transcriptional regulator [Candidatus Sumerlaeota bacterium]